jgi:hypothetical protein
MALRQQGMLRAARFAAGLFSAACLNECLESDGSARFASMRTSPTASKSPWPRTATTCWPMALSASPARAMAFTVAALSGPGGAPVLAHGAGIRALEEASARVPKRTHFRC